MFFFPKSRSRSQKILRDSRGETMVEVLVALTILLLGAFAALQLMTTALVKNELTKERVVATNLAREGIEAVRNIRDTNWLRYAGERRRCWNNLDSSTCEDNDDDGIPDNAIKHQQPYIAEFEANYRWKLAEPTSADRLDLTDGLDEDYRLYSVDELYNHDDAGTTSPYYRELFVEYLNNDGADLTSATPPESANVMRVTSKVEWYDRGKISNVTLTTILTDYLGRADHE